MDENVIRNIGNPFRLEKLKKETNDAATKAVTNPFRQKRKQSS